MSKPKKPQCIGEHQIGAFQIGPAGWQRCQASADFLLDIKGVGGEKGYVCKNCYQDVLKSGAPHKIVKTLTVIRGTKP
jgi:hypothetical protein